MPKLKPTEGKWNHACDSYGKVQHSRKYDCVYSTIKGDGGMRLVTVAARIENGQDAKLMAAAPELYAACYEAFDLVARVRCAYPEHASKEAYDAAVKLEETLREALRKAETNWADPDNDKKWEPSLEVVHA